MNYGVGDEVVCIIAVALHGGTTHLKAGGKYKVLDFHKCCGTTYVAVTGCPDPEPCLWCFEYHRGGYYPWRFIKLDGLKETQTAEDEVTA